MTHLLATLLGLAILLIVLLDTFETIVLPRTVTRLFRLTRLFYRTTWAVWAFVARYVDEKRRDNLLGAYGPLSLLLLLVVWALGLITGFALVQWGLNTHLDGPDRQQGFLTTLYFSGTTFFTVGFGDVTARGALGRAISVCEAGLGFGFLGAVIGYLPVLYQAFSKREVGISLLDSRASSPSSAVELIRRHAAHMQELTAFLAGWEKWGAEVLESHLSYPILVFYRSQHDRQSWLAAMTTLLDACALIRIGFEGDPAWEEALFWQAERTFAISRHAAVDLTLVLSINPLDPSPNRLPAEEVTVMLQILQDAGLKLKPEAAQKLAQIRCGYEPYVNALANRLALTLPPWLPPDHIEDNWQSGAWSSAEHF